MDFYTHGTLENGDEDRSNKFTILAHNSQIYQNLRSIELGIVVRRIVKVFSIVFLFFLLFTCCPARLLFICAVFWFQKSVMIQSIAVIGDPFSPVSPFFIALVSFLSKALLSLANFSPVSPFVVVVVDVVVASFLSKALLSLLILFICVEVYCCCFLFIQSVAVIADCFVVAAALFIKSIAVIPDLFYECCFHCLSDVSASMC